MSLHLRQIALVARELAPVIDDLSAIFGIKSCFVDPGVKVFGLENTLLAVGRNFLEVVAPIEDNTAGGRYLDRRGGDGGYMVICQATDANTQDSCKRRAADASVRVAWEREHDGYHIMQLHPGDLKAAFFEIDWDERGEFDGTWHPAGGLAWTDSVTTDVTTDFLGVELQGPEPAALALLWGDIAGVKPVTADGQLTVQLDNATLRFVEATDGRGPGLGGVDLAVADRRHVLEAARQRGAYVRDDQVLVGGTRFYLR
jgi:hypothetical protein